MNTFYLFPSNAVLLGLAVGEFERLHELHETDTFEAILYRRLRPFVPDPHEVEVPIEESNFKLPPGYCWYDAGDGTERSIPDFEALSAFSNTTDEPSDNLSFPSSLEPRSQNHGRVPTYIRRGSKVFRVEYVEGKRNLIELVTDYLRPEGAGPLSDSDKTLAVLRRWKILDDRSDRPESPRDIERKIRTLVGANQLENEYAFGKVLGRVFGDCIIAEKRLVYMEETFDDLGVEFLSIEAEELSDEPDLRESWASLVRVLSNDPVFRECHISQDFLRNGKGFWGGTYFGLTRSQDNQSSEVNSTLCVRTTLCLILGHVLGWLHFRDLRAGKDDATAPIPRSLALPVAASDEMIAGQLLMVEQTAFNEQLGRHFLPETVIRQIGNAVEGMSRQLWPNDFENVKDYFSKLKKQGNFPKTGLVQEVLQRKKTAGTVLEKKFASGAEPLQSLFRNVSEHEPNTFRCSWHEAHFFHVGIRLLHDLKRRIVAERRLDRA